MGTSFNSVVGDPPAMDEPASGVWPVMLTPFTETGAIDWPALERLTEWYIDAGVGGLFAVSLSSEMFELSPEERARLAETVVDVAAGRVPVVATGTFGGDHAASVTAMADAGVDAVVLNAATLVGVDESEEAWRAAFDALVAATDVPLGLYECPRPYHRLLSTATLEHAGATRRVSFLKDTCCDRDRLANRIAATAGTPLGVCNANVPTLLESLRVGATGYSGTLANVCPALLAWLVANPDADVSDALHRDLTLFDHAIRPAYPASTKAYHERWGVGCTTTCRTGHDPLRDRHAATLERLHEAIDAWHDRLDIDPPTRALEP